MTKIYSYLTSKDINPNYQFKGIDQPLDEITEGDLREIIKSKLNGLAAENGIKRLSYLNMWCQINWKECHRISMQELKKLGFLKTNVDESRALLHRDVFLYVIAELIMGEHTGQLPSHQAGGELGQSCFTELFILMNVWLSRITNERTLCLQLLRDNPQAYNQNSVVDYYLRWIIRYWNIYIDILATLDKPKDLIEKGLNLLVQDMNVTLKEYFQVIFHIFDRYLTVPRILATHPELEGKINPIGTNVFDVHKLNCFEEDKIVLRFLQRMSKDLLNMKTFILDGCDIDKQLQREFDPVFEYAIKLFHRPIFKSDDSTYHRIIDLKFLFDGICSGLVWRLDSLLNAESKNEKNAKKYKLQDLKAQYGLLLDIYFKGCIKKIFNAESSDIKSNPDAVVRSNVDTVIFEFTTEYYTIESLYSTKVDKVHTKLDVILFNEGGNKYKKKSSPGKFININIYIKNELEANPGSKIIPILVTERYLGDCSLLEKSGYDFEQKIKEAESRKAAIKLNYIKDYPPLIISLDELEIFWKYARDDKSVAIEDFILCVKDWQSENDKAQYKFNFGKFLEDKLINYPIKNKVYDDFFNLPKFRSKFDSEPKEAITIDEAVARGLMTCLKNCV